MSERPANHDASRLMDVVAPIEPGIVCTNIEQMRDFYVGTLGLSVVGDAEAEPSRSAEFGAAPKGYRIIRLQTATGYRLKLVQPHGLVPEDCRPPLWVFGRRGLAYVTLVVSDIHPIVAGLKRNGVRLRSQAPVAVRSGFVAIFAEDPEGNIVEFIQYDELPSGMALDKGSQR